MLHVYSYIANEDYMIKSFQPLIQKKKKIMISMTSWKKIRKKRERRKGLGKASQAERVGGGERVMED